MILTYPWPKNLYELLDPNQGYNHVKYERPPLNSTSENMSIMSLEYVQK